MDLIDDNYLTEALEENTRQTDKRVKYRKNEQGKQSKIPTWGKIVGSMAAALLLVFTGIVNLFPTVAFAVNDVIFLGDLAKAVTFDPSMKACLENEYAQYVGEQKLTEEGYASKVYYMVIDASRVSIFYKTDVPDIATNDGDVYSYPEIKDANGKEMGCATCMLKTEIEGLYEYQVEFEEEAVPEQLQFEIHYVKSVIADAEKTGRLRTEETISKSVYQLYPEEKYRKVIKSYDINQNIEINGQNIWVEKLEVYPTQAKLWFQEDKYNSAILLDMDVVLKDDEGREYDAKANGWTGSSNEREIGKSLFH